MEKKIWLDGSLVDFDNATIHVSCNTLHYGGGVFEGIRFYDTDESPAIFKLHAHLDRLYASAACFNMKVSYSKEELEKAIIETVKANGLKEGYIRPIFFLDNGYLGFDVDRLTTRVAIMVIPWEKYTQEECVRVRVSRYRRPSPKNIIPEAKVNGYYAQAMFALMEAKKESFDGALMLDSDGNVAEGITENAFFVKDNKLITPRLGHFLPGITRQTVIKIAVDMGIHVEERTVSLEEIKTADEAFFTATGSEITPIKQIGSSEIGPGEPGSMTKRIKETYFEIVKGQTKKYGHWLTVVM